MFTKGGKPIHTNQHCTSKRCPYTLSHTAGWCGYTQTKRCKCPYCKAARQQIKAAA